MHERLYQLKIELKHSEPAIWRRFVVPASISLDRLHDVIQIVMGWQDEHLHEFTIGKQRYTEHPEFAEDGKPCGRFRLSDLVKQTGRQFSYLYDFGDHWEHELTLENNRYGDPDLVAAVTCLEGERACPPEDVGGFGGFEEFCEVLADPEHEEHEHFKEWAGGDYQPEHFDLDAVVEELHKYLHWSRDRELFWDDQL